MSEYQFYEFLAIDRPLNDRQQAELRSLSTRADITATSFVNEYHWGNFRGDPRKLMERYFDAFLYITNWGTHQLALRLPERLLDLDTAQRYCFTASASAGQHGDHVIIDLCFSTDEGLDWDHTDETRLGTLTPLRTDLAAGDHRALYLGWLLAAQTELDEDEQEPPVPPGMSELTGWPTGSARYRRRRKTPCSSAWSAQTHTSEPNCAGASALSRAPAHTSPAPAPSATSSPPPVSAGPSANGNRPDWPPSSVPAGRRPQRSLASTDSTNSPAAKTTPGTKSTT